MKYHQLDKQGEIFSLQKHKKYIKSLAFAAKRQASLGLRHFQWIVIFLIILLAGFTGSKYVLDYYIDGPQQSYQYAAVRQVNQNGRSYTSVVTNPPQFQTSAQNPAIAQAVNQAQIQLQQEQQACAREQQNTQIAIQQMSQQQAQFPQQQQQFSQQIAQLQQQAQYQASLCQQSQARLQAYTQQLSQQAQQASIIQSQQAIRVQQQNISQTYPLPTTNYPQTYYPSVNQSLPYCQRNGLSEQQCIDFWISSNNLNQYGDPQGIMYAGGTPLFNEMTGQRMDRYQYIIMRNADRPWWRIYR